MTVKWHLTLTSNFKFKQLQYPLQSTIICLNTQKEEHAYDVIHPSRMFLGGPNWGGAVALWLVRSTLEQAGDIVLCSWTRHFTFTVPLSIQVYKWLLANLMLGDSPAMD